MRVNFTWRLYKRTWIYVHLMTCALRMLFTVLQQVLCSLRTSAEATFICYKMLFFFCVHYIRSFTAVTDRRESTAAALSSDVHREGPVRWTERARVAQCAHTSDTGHCQVSSQSHQHSTTGHRRSIRHCIDSVSTNNLSVLQFRLISLRL